MYGDETTVVLLAYEALKNKGSMTLHPVSDLPQVNAARSAGLRYFSDQTSGLRRKRAGKGFAYYTANGVVIREKETLSRIKALAIPPA